MRIKFGSLITDGRGKLGGHVAQKGATCYYLKTKRTPANPQSVFQSSHRGIVSTLSKKWRTITQAQRDAWNNSVILFSKTNVFGEQYHQSGFNLYIALNLNLNLILQPFIDWPPTPTGVPTPIVDSINIISNNARFTVVWSNYPSNAVNIVFATKQFSEARTYFKYFYRFMSFQVFPPDMRTQIHNEWHARWGNWTPNHSIGLQLVAIDKTTGIMSYPLFMKVITPT